MISQKINSKIALRFTGEFGIQNPHGIHLYVPNNQVIACPTVYECKDKYITKLLLSVMDTNVENRIYNRLFNMVDKEHDVNDVLKHQDILYIMSLLSNPYNVVSSEDDAVKDIKRMISHIQQSQIPRNYYDIVDYDVKDVLEDITFDYDDVSVDWSSLGEGVYLISLYFNDYSPVHLVNTEEDQLSVDRFTKISSEFKGKLDGLEEFNVTPIKLAHEQVYILQRKS